MDAKRDPDSPLSPDDQAEQYRLLATGRYRMAQVSEMFGQTRQALYNRMRRDPEVHRNVLKARAQGAARLADKVESCKKEDGDWTRFAWLLERVHGWQKPVDEARTQQIRREGRGGSESNLEQQRRLREFLAAASIAAEGDPTATAENAEQPA